MQQLIRNDGGKGVFEETVPPMLGIWDTLLKGEADATWVFMGWVRPRWRRDGSGGPPYMAWEPRLRA